MTWLTVQQDETHHDVKTSQIRPYRDRMRTSDPSPSARWVDIEGAVFDLVVWNAFWTQIYLQSRLCLCCVLFCFFSERIKISLHESTNSLRAPFCKSILQLLRAARVFAMAPVRQSAALYCVIALQPSASRVFNFRSKIYSET